MHVAAERGHPALVELLIKACATLPGRLAGFSAPFSHSSLLTARSAPLRSRKAGADLNAADGAGATPLHLAARAGQAKVVLSLLRAGADPSRTDADGRTARDAVAGGRDRRRGGAGTASRLPPSHSSVFATVASRAPYAGTSTTRQASAPREREARSGPSSADHICGGTYHKSCMPAQRWFCTRGHADACRD